MKEPYIEEERYPKWKQKVEEEGVQGIESISRRIGLMCRLTQAHL